MADQWFYKRGGVKTGPLSFGDLRRLAASGGLTPEDQIWKEGTFGWVPAGSVKALFNATGQTQTPSPTARSESGGLAERSPISPARQAAAPGHQSGPAPSVRPATPTPPIAPAGSAGRRTPAENAPETGSKPGEPLKPWWVGVAMFLFFPVGFLLLAMHPQLRARLSWWGAGIAWALIVVFAARQPDAPTPPETPDKPGDHAIEPSPERPPSPSTPGLGDSFTLGNFKYCINNVSTTRRIGKSLFGEFVGEEASAGAVFVIVSYTIENLASESQTVLSDDFKIEDSRGRTFKPASDANVALLMESDDKDFLLSELQPGLPRAMKQAFELPEQAIESPITVVVPEKGLWATGSKRVQVQVR